MSWQVIITENPISENGTLIIRYVLTDGIAQKIPYEYRSQNYDVAAFKAFLVQQLTPLNDPKEGIIDQSLVPGPFDPNK